MLTLPVLALISATLFADAAAYITIVEHPARLMLEDGPMLAQWQPSYTRALPIQAGLTVLGGVVGIIAFFQLRDWQWLVGSVVLLANWPFTLLVIMPTNKRLLATPLQNAGAESRHLLLPWGKLHNVRSALGFLALLLFAWSFSSGKVRNIPRADVSSPRAAKRDGRTAACPMAFSVRDRESTPTCQPTTITPSSSRP